MKRFVRVLAGKGGIRVAFALSWKGHIAPGRLDDLPVIQLDVLPTALAAAGVAMNASEFDGVNLLPDVNGAAKGTPHDALYWRLGGMMALRGGDWKLVKTRDGPLIDVDPSVLHDLSEAGLYNVSEDIGETWNRAAERPDKVNELAELWQQWSRRCRSCWWVLANARLDAAARLNDFSGRSMNRNSLPVGE
jgi:arylsulfatase A-like enzyme